MEMMQKGCSEKSIAPVPIVCRYVFLAVCMFFMACIFLTACTFFAAGANFYPYVQRNITMRHTSLEEVVLGEETAEWEDTGGWEAEAAWKRAYLYVICNMQEYLASPYKSRNDTVAYQPVDEWVYLGIHDFDGDGTPELLAGNTMTMAVFTFTGGQLDKLADLYCPDAAYWRVDGVYFKGNSISVGGADGSGFVNFEFEDGVYIVSFAERVHEEEKERIRLVHGESGWILQFQTGEETALDSGFDYDLIRW